MIFSKDMDNLKIYKRPMFLPTLENDKDRPNKKTGSAIYLLAPNRKSSVRLMTHPMTINRTRYQSYYIERDLTYFISSKVLKAENLDESTYVTEGNIFNNVLISGFDKDTAIIKTFFTPEIYHNLLDSLQLYVGSDKPILHIIVGDFPERDGFFSMRFENNGVQKHIFVNVPRCDTGLDMFNNDRNTEYAQRVLNFVIKALVISKYPYIVSTALPAIVADAFTGADTKEGNWGRWLFFNDSPEDESEDTKVPNIGWFWDQIEKNSGFAGIVNDVKTKFPEVRINDIVFESHPFCAREAGSAITMDNLSDKFKYATTTKFKRKLSTKVNAIKRSLEKIGDNFNITMNLPTVGTASISSSSESVYDPLNGLTENEDYFILGENTVMFLNEDAKYDTQLKKLLYNDRIRKASDIQLMNKQIKADVKDIKYTFIDLSKYGQKNVFIDLYYYNQVFFKNNTWVQKKGFDLYLDLLNRLINDSRVESAGYKNKTIFIPVRDWDVAGHNMWLYRENINPVSIIYELMYRNPQKVKATFKDMDIIFFGNESIFKINFSQFKDINEIKKMCPRFKNFIVKMTAGAERFEASEMDTTVSSSPEAIKADIYDKFEDSQGIDLTGREKELDKQVDAEKESIKKQFGSKKEEGKKAAEKYAASNIIDNFQASHIEKDKKEAEVPAKQQENISKGADPVAKKVKDEDLAAIAKAIDLHAQQSTDTDMALDRMEDNQRIKELIRNLDIEAEPGVKLSPTRAARFNNLSNELLDKSIENRSIRDILNKKQSENKIEKVSLDIATPNEEWQNLTYTNFDKNYDLDADIVNCINHFTHTSLPLAIVDLSAEDASTSEDRIKTYTIKYEDFNGKRHNIKLDIPIPKDNRFLLRGNLKVIATQFLNMPILKTDLDTAQIITNYQKIYVRRYNEFNGRSTPIASALIKALSKYNGRDIKISTGDNSKICNKYQLPIDYIDMASFFNTIEIPGQIKVYFNQDEIREDYSDQIFENKGVPYMVDLKTKEIKYYNSNITFASELVDALASRSNSFFEFYSGIKPSSAGTYTRCKILGTLIPLIVVASYVDGLEGVLKKSGIVHHWTDKLTADDRAAGQDFIKFQDAYLVYNITYTSSLLLNGLKDCPTEFYSIADVNSKQMYIEFLDNFGGRIKADGIENFNDCLVDPITKEVMEYYGLPTDFVTILLYTNNLLADNKFIKHTDTSSRRIRRAEMVASYTYEALSEAYGSWAFQVRHGRKDADIKIKQSVVIDKLLQSPISQDDSINNALGALEETNNISFKGKAGLNKDRAYSLDKRTYDDSMLNVLGASTAFSANVGIGRASTVNLNVDSSRGYVKQIDSDVSKLDTANTLTATEAMIPFEVNRDDNTRVSMSFVQTAKHQVRTNKADPLLVTSGIDQALPYLTTDTFAFKAKEDGKILEVVEGQYVLIEYKSGNKDYVSLKEEIKKNSDGGYFVPLQLDLAEGIKTGSRIKANQIIAYDKKSFGNGLGESDNIAYLAGDLAKVAIINTDDGFEDSGVVTESLAKDLTTQVIYEFDHVIEKDAIIYKMAKVGDKVNVEDPLLIWQDSFEEEDVSVILRVMGQDTLETSELGRKVIKSKTTGTVVGIKIFRTCDTTEMSDDVRKIVREYEAPIKELKKKLESEGISSKTLPATYALPAVGKLKKAEDAVYIAFYIQHDDIVGIGDKIVYFAANKAVIKNVIPDELAPYTDFRPNEPVSAFVSVVSINKRMVTSTLINGALNKLMVELDRKCKDMAGIPYDDSKI